MGGSESSYKKLVTLLDLCVSSLRRGHANLLCIVPILSDDPLRESMRFWLEDFAALWVCRKGSGFWCLGWAGWLVILLVFLCALSGLPFFPRGKWEWWKLPRPSLCEADAPAHRPWELGAFVCPVAILLAPFNLAWGATFRTAWVLAALQAQKAPFMRLQCCSLQGHCVLSARQIRKHRKNLSGS
jgi:hypothetical protein